MSFFLLFSLQCLFPMFDTTRVDEFLGLSIVNRDTQAREFTVTVIPPEGANGQSGRVTVPAGGERAQLVNEILGTPRRPASGWIRIDSAAAGCPAYLASGNESMLDGADGAPVTSLSVVIPNVSVFTGFVELNYIDTYLAVVNPGGVPANVTVRLFSLSGALTGTASLTVAAGGSKTFAVSETFRDVLQDNRLGGRVFQGYLRLDSNVAVAAWGRAETPLSRKLARGRGLEEIRLTTVAFVPHFVIGGSYQSILNLVNPGAAALSLELEALDDRGAAVGELVRLTLTPGQAVRARVDELFRVPSPPSPSFVASGYVRIRESQARPFQIAGDVEIFTSAFDSIGSSVFYPIGDSAATEWVMPFAANSGAYFSGYVVLSTTDLLAVQTDVQVEVLNASGVVVERRTLSLSPRTRVASVLTANLQSGYLRFTSNLPVHVVTAIGTRDGRYLDQIPAIR